MQDIGVSCITESSVIGSRHKASNNIVHTLSGFSSSKLMLICASCTATSKGQVFAGMQPP